MTGATTHRVWRLGADVDTDALARVESAISAYAGEAEHALQSARLSSSALDQLRDLADASISRTA